MFDRFTDHAKEAMSFARLEAIELQHEYIGTEHILLGLVRQDRGVAASILTAMNIDLAMVRREVERIVVAGRSKVTGALPFTRGAKRVLELSMEAASGLAHDYFGTEHLLIGLIREHEGIAAQLLRCLGVTLDEVLARSRSAHLLRSERFRGFIE